MFCVYSSNNIFHKAYFVLKSGEKVPDFYTYCSHNPGLVHIFERHMETHYHRSGL